MKTNEELETHNIGSQTARKILTELKDGNEIIHVVNSNSLCSNLMILFLPYNQSQISILSRRNAST